MLVTLAAMPAWAINLLVLGLIGVCVVLVLTVLIQKPQGGGLSAAFGASSGSGQTAFGTKTGDALTITTIIMFAVYLGFAIGLNHMMRPATAATTTKASAPGTAPATTEGGAAPATTTPENSTPAQPPSTEPAPTPATEPAPTPATTPEAPPASPK